MLTWPAYMGQLAYGIKMGVVRQGSDLETMVLESLEKCHRDGLLSNGDIVCVTESVVARAQGNYVTLDHVAMETRAIMDIDPTGCLGVVFPIASRNRFSLVLKGLARAVCDGRVVVQMSFPFDEVGNQVVDPSVAERMGLEHTSLVYAHQLPQPSLHPVTGVDYLALYQEIIGSEGVEACILLSNDPLAVMAEQPNAVIAADIHRRDDTSRTLAATGVRTATLQELCASETGGQGWSEWGLLGSNMSSSDRLKLAPRNASAFARKIQTLARTQLGIEIEVIINGDGAYMDPRTGIYELADPKPSFGSTDGLVRRMRRGVKYKLFADMLLERGVSEDEIEAFIANRKAMHPTSDSAGTEGTTPRSLEDIVASLADLVSGSADAATPVVVVRGFLGD